MRLYDCQVVHRTTGCVLHDYLCQHATVAEADAHAQRLMRGSERGRNVVVRRSDVEIVR